MLLEQALLDVVDRLEDVLGVTGEGVAVRPPPHLLEDQAEVQIALVRPAAAPLHYIRLYRRLNEYTIFVFFEKITNICLRNLSFLRESKHLGNFHICSCFNFTLLLLLINLCKVHF